MKKKIPLLVPLLVFVACGGPPPPLDHPPANTVDPDGYLVRSAYTTSGIPLPFVCYNGFDPWHYDPAQPSQCSSHGGCTGVCDVQPNAYTGNTYGVPITACQAGVIPSGSVELSTTRYYSNGTHTDSCSRISLAYYDGYYNLQRLAFDGWYQVGGGSPSWVALASFVRLPPNMRITYSDAPYLAATNSDPCYGLDPDENACVTYTAPNYGMYWTLSLEDVYVQSLKFKQL